MKEIPVQIQRLNQTLETEYGLHDNSKARFRVVWSEDQYETRFGHYNKFSKSGIWLGEESGYKYVPKYRQWMPDQWVLEELTPVEENKELVVKLSYEPLFGFRGHEPDYEVCKIIIDNLLENRHNKSPFPKYKIPEEELQTEEARNARIEKLEKYLFEDESNLTARLRFKEAIVHPGLSGENNESSVIKSESNQS